VAVQNLVVSADIVQGSFERLFAFLRRVVPNDGLSLTAGSTLARLERGGPRRLTELAGLEGVTQPAMTQLVSRLERDGLASRVSDPVDGRVVLVRITEVGLALLGRRRAARAEILTELLGRLSQTDRDKIIASLPAFDRLSDLLPPN
jgi:DNA-binding MarR family transcriptional regulator